MVYTYRTGVIIPFIQKHYKLIILLFAAMFASTTLAMTLKTKAEPAVSSGPGTVLVGVNASTWQSGTPSGPGLIPIGGSGQVNGEFTTAERLGIQIGLRAQQRFLGTIEATASENGKVGIYEAETGFSDAQERSKWNYDWHVDLRGAKGIAKGTTLADYDLSITSNIVNNTSTEFPLVTPANTVLFQSSQNPKFGNPTFDAGAEGTYNFTLTLTPKTFKNPPLSVTIQVNVNSPVSE